MFISAFLLCVGVVYCANLVPLSPHVHTSHCLQEKYNKLLKVCTKLDVHELVCSSTYSLYVASQYLGREL